MISRRALLTAPVLLSGCALGVGEDDDMSSKRNAIAPWHLWGNSQGGVVSTPGAASFPTTTQQMARIDYGRPETWSFFFFASVSDALGINPVIQVSFDLLIGIGRSTQIITQFENFTFTLPAEANVSKYSTSVNGPARVQASTLQNVISEFPAQSIQCTANVSMAASGGAGSAKFQATAQFAPKNHIRPEWFEQHFPGGEDQGT